MFHYLAAATSSRSAPPRQADDEPGQYQSHGEETDHEIPNITEVAAAAAADKADWRCVWIPEDTWIPDPDAENATKHKHPDQRQGGRKRRNMLLYLLCCVRRPSSAARFPAGG
jgi:hypothetical protein